MNLTTNLKQNQLKCTPNIKKSRFAFFWNCDWIWMWLHGFICRSVLGVTRWNIFFGHGILVIYFLVWWLIVLIDCGLHAQHLSAVNDLSKHENIGECRLVFRGFFDEWAQLIKCRCRLNLAGSGFSVVTEVMIKPRVPVDVCCLCMGQFHL